MEPQDDLTAERAAAKLAEQIRDDIGSCYFGSDQQGINLPWSGDWLGMLAGHIYRHTKTARQEALREAITIIRRAETWTPQSVLAVLECLARDNKLDRLASEGG